MNVYAYARVSARDQNLDRQIEAFTAFGVEKSRIFCDKKSGRDFDRSGYKKMFARLRRGDLLVIKSIDRLGRNYEMIIEEWRAITEKKGADILVLDMPAPGHALEGRRSCRQIHIRRGTAGVVVRGGEQVRKKP